MAGPLHHLGRALGAVGYLVGAEWAENPRAWPHCCGQARCWVHVGNPWCWCRCRWCALARWLHRGGGEPGLCRHCGDTTDFDDDPAPGLCVMCAKAGRL